MKPEYVDFLIKVNYNIYYYIILFQIFRFISGSNKSMAGKREIKVLTHKLFCLVL